MGHIVIRKGGTEDMDAILLVYEKARKYMRECGNLTQWTDGYPAREDVVRDIDAGNCYVGVDMDGEIVMCFAFIIGDDPTYSVIYDGGWINDLPYGTIHRMGSSGKHGGMLEECVKYCFNMIDNIRIDTHEDNTPMLKAIARLNFTRCGIILCRDGTPRIAFQKMI